MPDEEEVVSTPSETSADSENADRGPLTFYPAYCYRASPTWFTWVKLTASDIHNHLQTRTQFQALPSYSTTSNGWLRNQPLLLFYLNHPVQFVQLVGVVVTFEDYFDTFWVFTLDDSSGATLEVNCRKPEKGGTNEVGDDAQKQEKDSEADARYIAMNKLDIGTVVQIKGQITTFRDVRQLQLERILIVSDTNQEMRLVAARTDFQNKVLQCPWEVSHAKQKRLREYALGERDQDGQRIRKQQKVSQLLLEREKRHAKRVAKEYKREDRKRQERSEEARKAGHMLKRSP